MIGRLRRTNVVMPLLLLIAGCAASGPKVGSEAPPFIAQDADGNEVRLAAFEDKVLILDFWAVW
jgi:hypothetical protein